LPPLLCVLCLLRFGSNSHFELVVRMAERVDELREGGAKPEELFPVPGFTKVTDLQDGACIWFLDTFRKFKPNGLVMGYGNILELIACVALKILPVNIDYLNWLVGPTRLQPQMAAQSVAGKPPYPFAAGIGSTGDNTVAIADVLGTVSLRRVRYEQPFTFNIIQRHAFAIVDDKKSIVLKHEVDMLGIRIESVFDQLEHGDEVIRDEVSPYHSL